MLHSRTLGKCCSCGLFHGVQLETQRKASLAVRAMPRRSAVAVSAIWAVSAFWPRNVSTSVCMHPPLNQLHTHSIQFRRLFCYTSLLTEYCTMVCANALLARSFTCSVMLCAFVRAYCHILPIQGLGDESLCICWVSPACLPPVMFAWNSNTCARSSLQRCGMTAMRWREMSSRSSSTLTCISASCASAHPLPRPL